MRTNGTAAVQWYSIIGPDKQLELSMKYPLTVGRNFPEVIRALDALQLSTSKDVARQQIGRSVSLLSSLPL